MILALVLICLIDLILLYLLYQNLVLYFYENKMLRMVKILLCGLRSPENFKKAYYTEVNLVEDEPSSEDDDFDDIAVEERKELKSESTG